MIWGEHERNGPVFRSMNFNVCMRFTGGMLFIVQFKGHRGSMGRKAALKNYSFCIILHLTRSHASAAGFQMQFTGNALKEA